MYQIDNSTAAQAIPASTAAGSKGYFTDGNPATGTPATILPAEFMNMLMMENLNVLSAGGISPDKAKYNQLALAISNIIKSTEINWGNIGDIPAASATSFGVIRLATQAQVDAGTDSAAAVTSATLAVRLASAISTAISNIGAATTSAFGVIRLATQAQVDAGTDSAAAVTSLTLATRLAAALSGKLNVSGGSIAGSLNIDSPQSLSAPALSVSTSTTGSSLTLIRLTGPNTGILLSHQNNTNTLSVSNISGAVAAISAGDVLSSGSLCHTASSFMKPVAGQWLSIAGALTLPPGGTWAFHFLSFNNTGSFLGGSTTGLVAGGTQIGSSTSAGFAWRYQ